MTLAPSLSAAAPPLAAHGEWPPQAWGGPGCRRAPPAGRRTDPSLALRRSAGPGSVAPRAGLPSHRRESPAVHAVALEKFDAVLARLGLDNAHILRRTVPLQGFDLAAAVAGEWQAHQGLPAAGAPCASRTGQQRAILECMRVFAMQAYYPAGQPHEEPPGRPKVPHPPRGAAATPPGGALTEVGGLRPLTGLCSDAMKLWSAQTPEGLSLVLAMAGTRFILKDVSVDLASHRVLAHGNPLDASLPALEAVGKGWSDRWTELAQARRAGAQSLREFLSTCAAQCAQRGQTLQVMLAGHSMGGAVATLAGYDIAHFLARHGVRGMTSVYAFNPPRLGAQAARDGYQRALAGLARADAPAAPALALRQLTRDFDPVQSLPAGLQHPLWHDQAVAGAYHARGTGVQAADLLRNHDLKEWPHEIATMPAGQVARLFDSPSTAGPDPS